MDAFEILVIILSVGFAFLLLLAITCLVFVIKLLRKANHAAYYVELTASNLAAAAEAVKGASGPAALIRVLTAILRK